jgi:hypothetical protein
VDVLNSLPLFLQIICTTLLLVCTYQWEKVEEGNCKGRRKKEIAYKKKGPPGKR